MSQRTDKRRRLFSRAIIVCPSKTSMCVTWDNGTGNPSAVWTGSLADCLRGGYSRAVELHHNVKPPIPFVQCADGLTTLRGVDEFGHVLDAHVVAGTELTIRRGFAVGLAVPPARCFTSCATG